MKEGTLKTQFTKLYEAESDAVFRFCLIRVSDREQALDLTQETFTRLWRELHDKKDIANTRAFLFTVARHLVIDWYRKKKSLSLEGLANVDTGEAYEPVDELAHAHIELAAEGRFLIDAIGKLSLSHRQPIYLRFVEGLSPPEIAEIMKLSANAVSVRLNRGLEELRKITGYDIREEQSMLYMNNHSFHKGIQDIKNIKMTHVEKQAILGRVMATQISEQTKHVHGGVPHHGGAIKSPWSVFSFKVWFEKTSWNQVSVIVALLLIISGGFASASSGSLPGDLLYSIKTSIVEPLRGAFVVSPQAKAQWESMLASERLHEAEILADEGTLDLPKQKQIDTLLGQHTTAFTSALVEAAQATSTEEVDHLKTKFSARLKAHTILLDTISAQAKKSESKSEIADMIRTARTEANTVASMPSAGLTIQATSTSFATSSSATATQTISSDPANDLFKKHKNQIEGLIKGTHEDITSVGTDTSSLEQSVLNGTTVILDEATKSLNAAEWHNNKGDIESATKSLKKSEQQAIEADSLFRAGLKLENSKKSRDLRSK